MANNDFNLDKQEYQSVFKVFDRDNTGEINIGQVYELINKFDDAQKNADGSGAADVSMNGGGMSGISNGLIIGGASKSTGKSSSTNTGGSKSPTKKPITSGLGLGAGLQIKPTALDGGTLLSV